jgi:O-antigen/teichoic acid export membrane protein
VGRRVVAGAGVNVGAFAAVLAVSFLLTPYLIRGLGPAYDVWVVVEGVLAYFTLLDLGVGAGVVRVVARGVSAKCLGAASDYVSAALVIFAGAAVVALAVGTPVLLAMAPRLTRHAPDALPFMLVMLANLALTLATSAFPAVLDGLQAFTAKGVIRVAALVVRTAAIVGTISHGGGLLPLALVFLVTNAAEQFAYVVVCRIACPGLTLRPFAARRETLRLVRGESWDAFLAMLAGRVTLYTGAVVLGLLLPAGSATAFATAVRLTEYAKQLLRQVTTTLTPGVSAMHAAGDDAGIRRLLLTGTRWVLYAALPVNLGLFLFSGPFLARWVGPEFAAESGPAALILSGTLALGLAQSVAARILYGLGHLRFFARAAIVEGVLNLTLTALLVRHFGVEGVAAAVALPQAIFCVVVVLHTVRLLGLSPARYLRSWARPAALSAVPLAVWLALGRPAADWWAITATVVAGLTPYALAVSLAEGFPVARRRYHAYHDTASHPTPPETPDESPRLPRHLRRPGRRPGALAGHGTRPGR